MTKIVILAAGKGKRMNCLDTPKVLIPFMGKPILDYVVKAAKESGVDEKPVIVIGFCGQKIKDYFGDSCLYAEQKEQKGTGHAVLCAKEIAGDAENILVLNGDHPLTRSLTIKKLATLHEKNNAVFSLLTTKIPDFNGWYKIFEGYGRVIRDERGEIQKMIEWKDAKNLPQKNIEFNPTFFCFKSDWLWARLPLLKNENSQNEYYLTDLVEMAIQEKVKIAHDWITPEECVGVNTPEQLKLAEELYKSRTDADLLHR